MSEKRILMIDDDVVFLELMEYFMRREGYDLMGLPRTDDIAGLVHTINPDLLILDYCMPGVNGGELCRRVRSCPDLEHLPVMLVSAYPQEALPLDKLPFSVFITKPFDLWEFLSCVQELLTFHVVTAA